MKKIKFFILLCLLGMVSIGASAEIVNGECGIKARWTFDTETGSLSITGQGDMEDWKSSSFPWWKYRESITSVEISDDITSIGSCAFYNLVNLKSVHIGNSVKSIGSSAFYYCYKLETINFPNSITYVGNEAFESAKLPVTEYENLRYLGPYLVGPSDRTLTSYTIKEGTKFIGSNAFKDCSNAKNIYIPESVTQIGSKAIYDCSSLSSIHIPNSVTTIGITNFYGCSQLIETIDNLKYIDTYLYGTANKNLETYSIKEGTRFIGDDAFSGANLTSIEIPASVVEIQFGAFRNCEKLSTVTFEDEAQLQIIGRYAFYRCTSLQSINLPANVVEIGDDAFEECTSLQSVQFGDKIANIGENAFYNCSMLSSPLVFSNTFHSIGKNAFYCCTKIPSIQFAENSDICSLAYGAFRGCVSVSEITIPKSIIKIDDYAFCRCDGLTKLTFEKGSNLKYIGDHAFYGIPVTTISIPETVTDIKSMAFNDCAQLKNLYLPWKDADKIVNPQYDPFLRFYPDNGYGSINFYIPIGTIDLYNSCENWSRYLNKHEIQRAYITKNDDTEEDVNITENGELEINDNIKSLLIDGAVKNVDVSYSRNFVNADVWQAWYMPFDVSVEDMSDNYEVAQIAGTLLDADGNTVIAFLKKTEGTVKANTPYVVKAKSSGDVVLETTTDLQPTASTNFYSMSVTDKFTFGGVYEQTTNGEKGWYALNNDGDFQKMGENVYLRPFRIYMTIEGRSDNPYATSAGNKAKMKIMVIGDDEATGIAGITADKSCSTSIYNLAGQKVSSLNKGKIYIINGKKYIAK